MWENLVKLFWKCIHNGDFEGLIELMNDDACEFYKKWDMIIKME